MNLYLRYFDRETLAYNVEEALDFLYNIPEIGLDANLIADIREYANSDVMYPKRYKVRPRVYFIIIKTVAATMQDFKEKKAVRQSSESNSFRHDQSASTLLRLNEHRPGWYEAEFDFKRVVTIPSTGKHEYRDTHFAARMKATSGQDCYNRVVEHLRGRVDSRSQFPSMKGKNFRFKYLGMWK